MGQTVSPEGGYVPCRIDGCGRPARSQRKPDLCHACQARASYHRRNPDAAHKPLGFHGQWKGKTCACGQPVHCKGMCVSCYRKQYTPPRQTPAQRRASRIKYRYGITAEQYQDMVDARRGRCDICGQQPSADNTRAHWGGKLCNDHWHDSGKVRGLLCNDCNLAIGYGKSPETLTRAAAYLQLYAGSDRGDKG